MSLLLLLLLFILLHIAYNFLGFKCWVLSWTKLKHKGHCDFQSLKTASYQLTDNVLHNSVPQRRCSHAVVDQRKECFLYLQLQNHAIIFTVPTYFPEKFSTTFHDLQGSFSMTARHCTIFGFYIITSIRNIKFYQLRAVHQKSDFWKSKMADGCHLGFRFSAIVHSIDYTLQ